LCRRFPARQQAGIPAHTTKEDSLKSGSFLWVKILVSPVPCPTAGGDSGPHYIENQAIMKKIRSRFFLWYNKLDIFVQPISYQ
jgi:hypothetical protein